MRIVRPLFWVVVTLAIAGALSADDKYDQSERFKPTETEVVAEAVKAAANDAADVQQALESVVSRFDAELSQLRQSLKDAEAVNVDLRQRLAESEKELTALNAWKERLSVQIATLEKQVGDHDVMLRAPTLAEEKPDDTWKDVEPIVTAYSTDNCPHCDKAKADESPKPFRLIWHHVGLNDEKDIFRFDVTTRDQFGRSVVVKQRLYPCYRFDGADGQVYWTYGSVPDLVKKWGEKNPKKAI